MESKINQPQFNSERSLRLYRRKHEWLRIFNLNAQPWHIDVSEKPHAVDARWRSLYDTDHVSGIDERVLAVVASQYATAKIFSKAIDCIENNGLSEFTFVCAGATHRSVACCLLMSSGVYLQAVMQPTTTRVRNDAAACTAPNAARARNRH